MEPRDRSTRRNESRGGILPADGIDPEGWIEPASVRADLGATRCHDSGADPVVEARALVVEPATTPTGADCDWRTWLAGSPREVLARIVPGDPLGVRDAVAAALRAECVFLDADRVHLRALALVARGAVRYRGRPELATWLTQESERAVAAILREDAESRRDPDGAFVQLARPLGLDADALRRGCTAFNRLPPADRAAFFALAIWNRRLDDLVRESGESATEIARRARRGLDAVMLALQPEPSLPARPTPAAQPARPEELP